MSAESPRHVRSGGPLTVPSQPPSDRSIIDAVSGFINDVTLSSSSTVEPKDVIQWARFETADINEPTPEGDSDNEISPLLLILGYGSGVQVWLIPPNGEAQEVLSWRQGTVRVLRILPTPQHGDCFASKRPLIALCDSASPGPAFCSLSFISIRGGEQVKSIKFKNPILDVLANKRSVVVSFSERFAVFDAGTLEDRMAVTTCYPCPCPLGGSSPINPLALGDRWLAYADKKLIPTKRSSGGCESEGVTSYTATVLHAAKSLSKGLRGLGETVANSLAGGRSTSQSPSPPHADLQQPGVVTVLDIEGAEDEDSQDCEEACDPIVAHFIAHSEAIIALKFDPSGMLLVTADRRGHDFHVFRINPHPCGPSLASVHHLYVLHRGDTTAKVQDIAISGDSRWAAVSTLRGTTHVFAMSPYGGACGVRTHTQPRVVNRLSRFHRSAGLPIHAPPHHSPVCDGLGAGSWFPNPRLPPYPLPTTSSPLAQLRPTHNIPTHTITRTSSGRQRLSSVSEEGLAPLLARAVFGSGGGPVPLYLVVASGALLHLLLHPRPARGVPKEKVSDETPIELEVEAVAQWPLQRPPAAADLLAPLPPSNPLLQPFSCRRCADMYMSEEERWLSQVEIVTHAGPHRRLWMGPQFVFKTFSCTGSNSSLSEAETVEVEASAARSTPVNMPSARPLVPVLIDSGSASSLEQSPSDRFRRQSLAAETGRAPSVCDVQLREDLAEAMKEDHGPTWEGRVTSEAGRGQGGGGVARAVGPLGTVVAAGWAPPPPPPEEQAAANDDEAAFRPLVRAPLPAAPPPPARPLPRTTTIPAQPAPAPPPDPSPPDPQPLTTDVVIPALLSRLHLDHPTHAPDLVNVARPNVDNKHVNNELYAMKRDSSSERTSAVAELECLEKISLPESNRRSDDIQPIARNRVKKSPTTKSVSDKTASDVRLKETKDVDRNERKETKKENLADVKCESFVKYTKSENDKIDEPIVKSCGPEKIENSNVPLGNERNSSVPELPEKILPDDNYFKTSEIKTEEQAWDMLLNEPKRSLNLLPTAQSKDTDSKPDDNKMKTKKNRRSKKLQDETPTKTDDDSFIEIHAIDSKQQNTSEDLVCFSTVPETSESYLSKSKKSRSSKSRTPERKTDEDLTQENQQLFVPEPTCNIQKNYEYIDTISEPPRDVSETKDTLQFDSSYDITNYNESVQISLTAESPKSKSKSCSPKPETYTSDSKETEVYIINTAEEDFPEIQITKGNKSRKKSPQQLERKSQDSVALKPIKSWSSIAASKNSTKLEKIEITTTPKEMSEENACVMEEKPVTKVSLQDKLIELCKRTDIMVAECDAPSELNFVEEHHSLLQDLPPLEPLDFGLDDFKLEVMRDSLLDVNDPKISSPICKINIDDILSSIKETTNKVLESSSFNLVDIEKVPGRREKGFSIVESDKIISQEVKLDDESKLDKDVELEKSSDDDVIPGLTSDGASNAALPSKQSKSKKSRKKKK